MANDTCSYLEELVSSCRENRPSKLDIKEGSLSAIKSLAWYMLALKSEQVGFLYDVETSNSNGIIPSVFIFKMLVHIPGCDNCNTEYQRRLRDEYESQKMWIAKSDNESERAYKLFYLNQLMGEALIFAQKD